MIVPDSARLRYRLMDGQDARDRQLWWELDQDPEVMRFLNHGQPTSWDEIESFIVPRVASFTDPAAGHGLWEMADRQSGEHLGWILVRNYRFDKPNREHDNIEFGWRLKRAHWNKGLTTEAARAIMAVLQQDPALRVFSSLAEPANVASTSVMKKLGMRYVEDRVHIVDATRRYAAVYYEMPSPGYGSTR